MDEHIILTDEDPEGKLKNYCYKICDNDTDQELQKCRGLVYKDEKPFLKSFGYTPVFTNDTIPDELHNLTNFRFFESYEGTLLRLFYNDINDKWYLSTHRKLCAENSFWGCKETFGERFHRFIKKEEYIKLDKMFNYMFIITPSQSNRIVCNENLNRVIHVGTYDQYFNLSLDNDISIPRPIEFIINTLDELKEAVSNINYKGLQGIIACDYTNHKNYKILNDKYMHYTSIRNNTPSIKFRYLQVRLDVEIKNELYILYPDYIQEFEKYEGLLLSSCRCILDSYIKRFIQRKYTKISPEEYKVMKECHTWHLLNKQTNKIDLKKIIQEMNKQTPIHLNRIIKIYKNK